MPVSPDFAESNRRQAERLRKLVARLDASMLAVRLPNGWTVAVALAHIAFWDRQRLCLMRRWAAGNWCNGGYDGELFNEVLLPFLKAIPPDRAVEMAVQTAEEVDAFLLSVPDEVLAHVWGGKRHRAKPRGRKSLVFPSWVSGSPRHAEKVS